MTDTKSNLSLGNLLYVSADINLRLVPDNSSAFTMDIPVTTPYGSAVPARCHARMPNPNTYSNGDSVNEAN